MAHGAAGRAHFMKAYNIIALAQRDSVWKDLEQDPTWPSVACQPEAYASCNRIHLLYVVD